MPGTSAFDSVCAHPITRCPMSLFSDTYLSFDFSCDMMGCLLMLNSPMIWSYWSLWDTINGRLPTPITVLWDLLSACSQSTSLTPYPVHASWFCQWGCCERQGWKPHWILGEQYPLLFEMFKMQSVLHICSLYYESVWIINLCSR